MTTERMLAIVHGLLDDRIAWDMVDWSGVTETERRDILVLLAYEMDRRRDARKARGAPQRRARRFLRSLLDPSQRADLRRRRSVRVVGSAGGTYRLYPQTGAAARLERHGTREYAVERFCLHTTDRAVPPADESIAHLLTLAADEGAFRREANVTPMLLWDRDWLRRLAAARRERAVVATEGVTP